MSDMTDVELLAEAYASMQHSNTSQYNEITVDFEWYDEDSYDNQYAEIMVDVDDTNSQIKRAYTYKDDSDKMPERWIAGPSQNPLFVYLSREFIIDNKGELHRLISDRMLQDAEEESRR